MRAVTEEKILALARHMVKSGDTVRMCAGQFYLSKSAVHKMLGAPLRDLHPGLYREVREVMEYHKAVKHLRGGEATRQKYLLINSDKNR